MSRSTVRAAVAAFLSPASVPGVMTVYTSLPKRIDATALRPKGNPGLQTGCAATIWIESEREQRTSLGGSVSGKKRIQYVIAYDLFTHSMWTHAEQAMADFDTIVENVKSRIRADRTLGTGGVLFQAGENQLEGSYGEPKVIQGGATEIWGRITFDVSEFITA
jgi:hypothetical protein